MKSMNVFTRGGKWFWIAGLCLAVAGAPARSMGDEAKAPIAVPPVAPADPQPDAAALKDGLAVRYYFSKFTHIDNLAAWMNSEDGIEGEPLPNLDYQMGAGNVLTTTSADLVGAHITGFMDFPEAGTYELTVTSNDGVRVTLGGVMMFEDPEIHADTASPRLVVRIEEPGWYPLDILYYEKKGSAALKLHWKKPGESAFSVVPTTAFKHS
jgi:hypothetical protein